jgi:xanthine permease
MPDRSLGTPEQLRDPDWMPPPAQAVPLGIQHVLAMFVSNVTPAIIVAGAAGFGFGTPDEAALVYMIQMSILFAGVATLIQTLGAGPVGARLPLVHGTSFAFVPVMVPLVAGKGPEGMAVLTGGVIAGALVHLALAPLIGKLRPALPPLVTGLVVLMIGLSLLPVGIQYAAGGPALAGTSDYGTLAGWGLALVVVVVTLGLSAFGRGIWSVAGVLAGLLAGQAAALALGMVDLSGIGRADWVAAPIPLRFGVEVTVAAVLGFGLMAVVSAIETVGDVTGVTRAGAGRAPTTSEVVGATYGNAVGTLLAGLFGGLPNTSFSQNTGLIALTGVMSRHVVTLGALLLVAAGFVPKVGAAIGTVPIQVLGGGVIVMFGMVCAAGLSILSEVEWSRRNMLIVAVALSAGLGLQQQPGALQHVPDTLRVMLATGLLPAAVLAIGLNLLLPDSPSRR